MTKILSVGILIIFLLLIVELCRSGRLTFKYALGWLLFAVIGIGGAIFDGAVSALARAFGFIVTSNFIFFSLMIFFIVLSLFLTTFLCQQNKRNDLMAQKIALLQCELQEIKNKVKSPHG